MSNLIHKCFIVSPLLAYTCVCHARKSCMRDERGVPSAASFRSGIAHHLCRCYHAHHLLEMKFALQSARRDVESPGSGQPQLLFLHLYTFCWLRGSSGNRHPKHQRASHYACADLGEYVRWSSLSPPFSSNWHRCGVLDLDKVAQGNSTCSSTYHMAPSLACHPT
jgi:hypothetical protein